MPVPVPAPKPLKLKQQEKHNENKRQQKSNKSNNNSKESEGERERAREKHVYRGGNLSHRRWPAGRGRRTLEGITRVARHQRDLRGGTDAVCQVSVVAKKAKTARKKVTQFVSFFFLSFFFFN